MISLFKQMDCELPQSRMDEDSSTKSLDKKDLYDMLAHKHYLPPMTSRGMNRDYLLAVHRNQVYKVGLIVLKQFEVDLTTRMTKRVGVVNNGLLASKVGKPQTITANVTDPGIRAALGQQTIQVSFGLGAGVGMFGTAPATRVYIRATAEGAAYSLFGPGENFTMNNIPLTVGFDVGQGRVVFTSFHQERNITPDMQQVLNLLVFEL